MVEEVGQQDEIVSGSEIDLEGVAGDGAIAAGDSGPARVPGRKLEDAFPILRVYLGRRIAFENLDSERARARSDVEHLHRSSGCGDNCGGRFRGRPREGSHGLYELDPDGVVRLQRVLAGDRASLAHDGGDVEETRDLRRVGNEQRRRAEIGGRSRTPSSRPRRCA